MSKIAIQYISDEKGNLTDVSDKELEETIDCYNEDYFGAPTQKGGS